MAVVDMDSPDTCFPLIIGGLLEGSSGEGERSGTKDSLESLWNLYDFL
jgi:hypothetical protein